MRILSAALLEAQKSPSRIPFVKVDIWDQVGGVTRLNFTRLYSGTEADNYHAATMPSDGSLLRARIDPATSKLYLQRVTNPGAGSDFSSWTFITTVSSVSDVALCSEGSSVFLFYVETDQKSIYVRESGDNGGTYASPVLITTASSPVGWLAADLKTDGTVVLFYSVGSTVYSVKRSAGVWGTPASWTNTASSITGLATVYRNDWNVLVTGQNSSNDYYVWTTVFGDGFSQSSDSWSPLAELMLANQGSNMEFHGPFLGYPDVHRLFFVEKFTGTASYNRPLWSHSIPTKDYINNLWREPVPFNLTSDFGMAIAYNPSNLWLSTPSGVWSASLIPSSVEVSEDVLSLIESIKPHSGEVRIELRNDDSRYNNIGTGLYAAIKESSEIQISPGYLTSQGQKVSSWTVYWIERWEYVSKGGLATFILYAADGWGLLRRWKARRQFSWAAGERNLFQLISFIFARAGLEFATFSSSSTMVNHYPAFTIHPGERGDTAVRRLLAMLTDVVFFSGETGLGVDPQSSNPSDYSYGTDHPILEGRYLSLSPGINRVQVFGDGIFSEAFDWDEIEIVYDRLGQIHDLNLDTVAKADDRGQRELRHQEIGSQGGEITIPPNCGQELYDVIDITDGRAGLSSAKRRVWGLTLTYIRTRPSPRYDHRLILGGV